MWLIAFIMLWSIVNTSIKKDYKTGIIEVDAKGYYAYLPAVFIYHDLNFRFYYNIERETYYNPILYYQYLRVHNNKTINKYYAGTAICLAPFFLVGHVITLFSGYPADGYSYFYTMMVHLGALFYLLLGLAGLRKLLRTYNADDKTIALVLFVFVFGTNLFYYVLTEFAMSHVYSFAAITWFAYAIRNYFGSNKCKYFVYSAILLGMITLIRPVNILIILAVPFLSGSTVQFMKGIRNLFRNFWGLAAALFGFIALFSIQLIIYKLSTGSFFVYSYKQEGFNFLNPQILNFLFSYRKGMFVYTPLLFLCLAGFIFLFRKRLFEAISLLGFLFIVIYVLSSWHMWFYGGSFSQRVMIEFYAFFAILLAIALRQISNIKVKSIFLGLLFLVLIVCQVQTYQYRRAQIHWSDMNKEKYWDVFMRVDRF